MVQIQQYEQKRRIQMICFQSINITIEKLCYVMIIIYDSSPSIQILLIFCFSNSLLYIQILLFFQNYFILMAENREHTQEQLHRVNLDQTQNIKQSQKSTKNIRNEQTSSEMKKRLNGNNEGALKQSTNIVVSSPNMVKIKSKQNRHEDGLQVNTSHENTNNPLASVQQNENFNETRCKKVTNKSKFAGPKQFNTSKIILSPKEFMLKTVAPTEVTKCIIGRKYGTFSDGVQINLQGQNNRLICYETKFKLFGHKIIIKLPEDQMEEKTMNQSVALTQKIRNTVLGLLESNFDGSIFNLYELSQTEQQQEIIATFQYCTDIGKRGGPRKVRIYLKDKTSHQIILGLNPKQNLKQFIELQGQTAAIETLTSLPPAYDEDKQIYGMKFDTQDEIIASVHNLLFLNKQKKPALKLYQIQRDSFKLQCYNPLSPLVGCAFAISSFLFKLASQ